MAPRIHKGLHPRDCFLVGFDLRVHKGLHLRVQSFLLLDYLIHLSKCCLTPLPKEVDCISLMFVMLYKLQLSKPSLNPYL
jgi:hypothetical protein